MDASSPSSSHSRHQAAAAAAAQLAVEDRIVRAVRHPLLLLHRSASDFFVLGATGNVYTVSISSTPSCTCPDRVTPCKHILFVLIRVLGLSPDNPSLKRRTLRPCHVTRLLSTPTSLVSLAGPTLRQKFHQLFFQRSTRLSQQSNPEDDDKITIEEGTTCPVCLDEVASGEGENNKVVVSCGTCRNVIHEDCLIRWKRSRGRRPASCVICRARWRDIRNTNQLDPYLNLAAYISSGEDDHNAADRRHGSTTGHFCSAG